MIRRTTIRALLLVLLSPLAAAAASHRADPLLFHVHGLSFSSDGKALLVPSHTGLAEFRDGGWTEESGSTRDITVFSVTETAIYASGHPTNDARRPAYFGLMKSVDGGKIWQALALAGEADFHLLAAGFRSLAVYVQNPLANPLMPVPGLYLSRDAGERFRRLEGRQPVTTAAFEIDGTRIRYVRALSNEAISVTLDGTDRRAIRLPHLGRDYVTHLAQSPRDERSLAIATRRRSVFLTGDGGSTWRQIAKDGDLP